MTSDRIHLFLISGPWKEPRSNSFLYSQWAFQSMYGQASALCALQNMLAPVLEDLPNVAHDLGDIILWGKIHTEHDATLASSTVLYTKPIYSLRETNVSSVELVCASMATLLHHKGFIHLTTIFQPSYMHHLHVTHSHSFWELLSWYTTVSSFATVVQPLNTCIHQDKVLLVDSGGSKQFHKTLGFFFTLTCLQLFQRIHPIMMSQRRCIAR